MGGVGGGGGGQGVGRATFTPVVTCMATGLYSFVYSSSTVCLSRAYIILTHPIHYHSYHTSCCLILLGMSGQSIVAVIFVRMFAQISAKLIIDTI